MATTTKQPKVSRRGRKVEWTPLERRAWRPSQFDSVQKFCLERIELPADTPEPGPLDLTRTPYIIQIAEDIIIAYVRRITVIAQRQAAKTTLLIIIGIWTIDQDPSPLQFTMGREKDAKTLAKHRMHQIIKSSPDLAKYIISESRDLQASVINLNNCHLYFETAGSAAAISGKPLKRTCNDEIHLWPADVEGEGNPRKILADGMTNYFDSLEVNTSTPTDENSEIYKQYLLGDQNIFHVSCLNCDEVQELKYEQVKIPDGVVEPEIIRQQDLAWWECAYCAERFNTLQRDKMMRFGHWIAGKPSERPSHRSYWLRDIISPWRTISEYAALDLECGGDPADRRAFYNTVLGRNWKDLAGVIELKAVDEQEGMVNSRGRVPADTRLLTGYVDWHGKMKGLFWSLWAWGSRRRGWLVDYGRVVSGKERTREWFLDVTRQLDEIFVEKDWIPEGSDKPMTPWVGADSGYKGQADDKRKTVLRSQAYDYARPRPRHIACKGEDQPNKDESFREFKAPEESKFWRGMLINTGRCKDDFTAFFNHGMAMPEEEAERESNYIQLCNGTRLEFIQQMKSEEKVKDRDGKESWQQIGSTPNHGWDTAIGAMAMALKKGWRRMKDLVEGPKKKAVKREAPERESHFRRRPGDLDEGRRY